MSNLKYAMHVEPENKDVIEKMEWAKVCFCMELMFCYLFSSSSFAMSFDDVDNHATPTFSFFCG